MSEFEMAAISFQTLTRLQSIWLSMHWQKNGVICNHNTMTIYTPVSPGCTAVGSSALDSLAANSSTAACWALTSSVKIMKIK